MHSRWRRAPGGSRTRARDSRSCCSSSTGPARSPPPASRWRRSRSRRDPSAVPRPACRLARRAGPRRVRRRARRVCCSDRRADGSRPRSPPVRWSCRAAADRDSAHRLAGRGRPGADPRGARAERAAGGRRDGAPAGGHGRLVAWLGRRRRSRCWPRAVRHGDRGQIGVPRRGDRGPGRPRRGARTPPHAVAAGHGGLGILRTSAGLRTLMLVDLARFGDRRRRRRRARAGRPGGRAGTGRDPAGGVRGRERGRVAVGRAGGFVGPAPVRRRVRAADGGARRLCARVLRGGARRRARVRRRGLRRANVALFELLDVVVPSRNAVEALTWLTTAGGSGSRPVPRSRANWRRIRRSQPSC